MIEIVPIYDGHKFKINYVYEDIISDNKPKEKVVSIDLGMVNLVTIYDPNGEQYIVSGGPIMATNSYYNRLIDKAKSLVAKNKPTKKDPVDIITNNLKNELKNVVNNNFDSIRNTKNSYLNKRKKVQMDYLNTDKKSKTKKLKTEKSSRKIKRLLVKRTNKINNHLDEIVKWISEKYSDCQTIIAGYNTGWKTNVNMGKKNNRKFYEIPYKRLITKLRDKLERNNQKLVITEESYTSICDALALERIGKHENYLGKRIKRGLFSSSIRKIINADLNGAINIMRKWKMKNGEIMDKITGKNLYNPKKIKIKSIHEALRQ